MSKARLMFLISGMYLTALASTGFAQCNPALVSDTPTTRFVLVSNEALVDTRTGLMWARCPLGYLWQNSSCELGAGETGLFDWQTALARAELNVLGDFDDWRLANKKELESIVDRSCSSPAINSELFPSTPASLFWSSTPNAARADVAWVIDFSSGAHRNLNKAETGAVRLVRDYSVE